MVYEILKVIKNAQGLHGYARVEMANDYDAALFRIGELAQTFPASELILVEIKPIKFYIKVEPN